MVRANPQASSSGARGALCLNAENSAKHFLQGLLPFFPQGPCSFPTNSGFQDNLERKVGSVEAQLSPAREAWGSARLIKNWKMGPQEPAFPFGLHTAVPGLLSPALNLTSRN